jgi:hypothetical protein
MKNRVICPTSKEGEMRYEEWPPQGTETRNNFRSLRNTSGAKTKIIEDHHSF